MDSMCALYLRASAGEARGQGERLTEMVQSGLKQHKTLRRSANCGASIFIVEKSLVMVYNKLINYVGVTGDFDDSRFRERNAYEKWKKT